MTLVNDKVITGLHEVQEAIARLGLEGQHTMRARKNIGEEWLKKIHEHFATATGPDGTAWPVSERVKREGVGQTNVDHSKFRDSFYPDFEGDDLVMASNDIRATVLTGEKKEILPKNGEFLVFHAADGRLIFARAVHPPPRPVLDLTDSDLDDFKNIFFDSIDEAWEGV
jgi:hypothetical protein